MPIAKRRRAMAVELPKTTIVAASRHHRRARPWSGRGDPAARLSIRADEAQHRAFGSNVIFDDGVTTAT